MSYYFATNRLVNELMEKYLYLSRDFQEQASSMQTSSHTVQQYFMTQSQSDSYKFVYNKLASFRTGQCIPDLEFNQLKKSFLTFNDPDLIKLLDTAFIAPDESKNEASSSTPTTTSSIHSVPDSRPSSNEASSSTDVQGRLNTFLEEPSHLVVEQTAFGPSYGTFRAVPLPPPPSKKTSDFIKSLARSFGL